MPECPDRLEAFANGYLVAIWYLVWVLENQEKPRATPLHAIRRNGRHPRKSAAWRPLIMQLLRDKPGLTGKQIAAELAGHRVKWGSQLRDELTRLKDEGRIHRRPGRWGYYPGPPPVQDSQPELFEDAG